MLNPPALQIYGDVELSRIKELLITIVDARSFGE